MNDNGAPNRVLFGKPNYVAGVNPKDLTGLAGLINTQRLGAAQEYRKAMKKAISKEPDCRMKTAVLKYLEDAKAAGGYVQSAPLMEVVRESMRPSPSDNHARTAVLAEFEALSKNLQTAAAKLEAAHGPADILTFRTEVAHLFNAAIVKLDNERAAIEVNDNRSDAQADLSSCLKAASKDLKKDLDAWQAECHECPPGDPMPSMGKLGGSLKTHIKQLAGLNGYGAWQVKRIPHGTHVPVLLRKATDLEKAARTRLLDTLTRLQRDGSDVPLSQEDLDELSAEVDGVPNWMGAEFGKALPDWQTMAAFKYEDIRDLREKIFKWPGFPVESEKQAGNPVGPNQQQIDLRNRLMELLMNVDDEFNALSQQDGPQLQALKDEMARQQPESQPPRLRREMDKLNVLLSASPVDHKRLHKEINCKLKDLEGYGPAPMRPSAKYVQELQATIQQQLDELLRWWQTEKLSGAAPAAPVGPNAVALRVQQCIQAIALEVEAKKASTAWEARYFDSLQTNLLAMKGLAGTTDQKTMDEAVKKLKAML